MTKMTDKDIIISLVISCFLFIVLPLLLTLYKSRQEKTAEKRGDKNYANYAIKSKDFPKFIKYMMEIFIGVTILAVCLHVLVTPIEILFENISLPISSLFVLIIIATACSAIITFITVRFIHRQFWS
jgi:ABC-type sugar transport system permease subunit